MLALSAKRQNMRPRPSAPKSPRNALVGSTVVVSVLLLYATVLGSRTTTPNSDSDPATVLASSRRATLEARWGQRRAHADAELRLAREEQQAASPPEPANVSQTVLPNLAASIAAEEPAAAAAERVAAGGSGCNVPPRPYHTILTSSSGGYQAWQCRVMHHHWKLQKSRDPCGEMGGFTRSRLLRVGDLMTLQLMTLESPPQEPGETVPGGYGLSLQLIRPPAHPPATLWSPGDCSRPPPSSPTPLPTKSRRW